MDKAIYVGMGGAQDVMRRLEIVTNNLANANTTGFRADNVTAQSYDPINAEKQSRTYTQLGKTYSDFSPGPIYATGRDLDVAISGDGFFAVQNQEGKEGYTRAGDFQLSKTGRLETRDGNLVLGESGLINIPLQAERIHIGSDGTVSVHMPGQVDLTPVGKLKVTKPELDQISKGTDGLFYMNGGVGAAPKAKNIKLVSNSLEGSNVNPVDALTQLIDVSRSFEFHTTNMKTLQDDASKANELLNVSR